MATSSRHDATKILTADHRALEELFGRLEATTPRAVKRRAALVERIIHKLSLHTATEEAEFYPELRLLRPELTDDVLVALEEHHAVKRTLLELERMQPDDERYMAKARVLMESVRRHVRAEERVLFPAARQALGAAGEARLGDALAQAKRQAPPRPLDAGSGVSVAPALAEPLDRAVEIGRRSLQQAARSLEASGGDGEPNGRRARRNGRGSTNSGRSTAYFT